MTAKFDQRKAQRFSIRREESRKWVVLFDDQPVAEFKTQRAAAQHVADESIVEVA